MPAEKTVSAKALRPERAWHVLGAEEEVSVARHRLWNRWQMGKVLGD